MARNTTTPAIDLVALLAALGLTPEAAAAALGLTPQPEAATTATPRRNAAGRLVDDKGRFVKAEAAPTAATQPKAEKAAAKMTRDEAFAKAKAVREERLAAGTAVCGHGAPWKTGALICADCKAKAKARKAAARTA